MEVKLKSLRERVDQRMTCTSVSIKAQVNSFITADITAYVNLYPFRECMDTKYSTMEICDWDVEFYIGDEKLSRSGVEELYNTLFEGSKMQDVRDAIDTQIVNKKTLLESGAFADMNVIDNLTKKEAGKLLHCIDIPTQTYKSIEYSSDFNIVNLANLARDPRVVKRKVLTTFEQRRLEEGTFVSPKERTVLLIKDNSFPEENKEWIKSK